jgi:hypothetical protein
LVVQSITTYKAHHRHVPARVVVLKTSRFRSEEAEGIDGALGKFGIDMADLLWVQESSPIAVFRDGNYPVLRGTFIDLRGKGLLYTRGSVPYYGTYPGLRPSPFVAGAARKLGQQTAHACERCSSAHQSELEYDPIRSKAARAYQGSAGSGPHPQAHRIWDDGLTGRKYT